MTRLDTGAAAAQWAGASVNDGLPLRDRTRFEPVEVIAGATGGRALAGTTRGVYLQTAADRWSPVANRESHDSATIPPTWLLCSGEHDIEVVRDSA